MTKGKIDKATAVKSILSDLKKGIGRKAILHNLSQKCTKEASTLRRWFIEAEKQYAIFKTKAEPLIEAKEIEALGELAKEGILSKIERQKILSDIAKGNIPLTKYIVCDGVIQEKEVVPNWADRKAAIAELNKMDGEYAPIKTDLTSKGEKIESNAIQIEIIKPADFED